MCGRVFARLFHLQGSSGLVMGWNPSKWVLGSFD